MTQPDSYTALARLCFAVDVAGSPALRASLAFTDAVLAAGLANSPQIRADTQSECAARIEALQKAQPVPSFPIDNPRG